jgi:hypothetical protein
MWFISLRKPRTKHTARAKRLRGMPSDPSFFRVVWFFLSVVAIAAGYVIMATH